MAPFIVGQFLGEATADLVEDQPDQRFGPRDVGRRHHEIEARRPRAVDEVRDPPVAGAGDLRHDGISVENEERHRGRQHARAFVVRLVEQFARRRRHHRVDALFAKMAGGHVARPLLVGGGRTAAPGQSAGGAERYALPAVISVVPALEPASAWRHQQKEAVAVGQFIGFGPRLGGADPCVGEQCRSPKKYHDFRPRVPRLSLRNSPDGRERVRAVVAELISQASVFRRKKSIPVDR